MISGFNEKDTPIVCGKVPEELDSHDSLGITLDEAIEWFREGLPEKEDYGKMVGAEPFAWGCKFAYSEPEGYFSEYAIRCFEEMQKLKDLHSGNRLFQTPVSIGQTVYLVEDRQVIETVVREVRILEDGINFLLDGFADYDYVTLSDYGRTWFLDRQGAETLLSNLELVRVGMLFPDVSVWEE